MRRSHRPQRSHKLATCMCSNLAVSSAHQECHDLASRRCGRYKSDCHGVHPAGHRRVRHSPPRRSANALPSRPRRRAGAGAIASPLDAEPTPRRGQGSCERALPASARLQSAKAHTQAQFGGRNSDWRMADANDCRFPSTGTSSRSRRFSSERAFLPSPSVRAPVPQPGTSECRSE